MSPNIKWLNEFVDDMARADLFPFYLSSDADFPWPHNTMTIKATR